MAAGIIELLVGILLLINPVGFTSGIIIAAFPVLTVIYGILIGHFGRNQRGCHADLCGSNSDESL